MGTTEAVVILYDLRTATKWRILEGHTGPVTALAFEQVSSGSRIQPSFNPHSTPI